MASNKLIAFLVIVVTLSLHGNNNTVVVAQLRQDFYSVSCPLLLPIVRAGVSSAVIAEPRMGASLLRLFYLDCFVNGCDGSILLDDTSSFTGEQNAAPNHNSARGFNVIDNIKTAVENACNEVVSCADILAMAAKESVELFGGPHWELRLGRKDSRTASQAAANSSIPAPTSSLSELISRFANLGLSTRDLVALSGAHTIGYAQCKNFRTRIYNDKNIDTVFAFSKKFCSKTPGTSDGYLSPLDYRTPLLFDNRYFMKLMDQKGLLHSDQELFNSGSTDSIVAEYSENLMSFRNDFAAAMTRMSEISPLTGDNGEIRKNCGRIN